MEKLKNCKHCGGTAQLREVPGKFRRGWVGCPRCKIYKQWVYDPAEAVKIWNMDVRELATGPEATSSVGGADTFPSRGRL